MPRKNALGIPNRRPTARAPPARKPTTPAERKTVPGQSKSAPRRPSKVIEAAKRAKEDLEKLEEEDQKEADRIRGEVEQKILGTEIDWYQYIKPHDTRDIEECAKVDDFNWGVFQHNNAMLPKINELLKKLGYSAKRIDNPPKYVQMARDKYNKMLFNDEFRVLKGIEFLADRSIFPVQDYDITKAPELADDVAEKEEIARLVKGAEEILIDISPAVGATHTSNCTCGNRWDGVSERCEGESVRLRWRRLKDHHFLRPRIIPEKF